MSYILIGEAARDARFAGGKAAALAQLTGAFCVPEFFAIAPTAFEDAGVKSEAVAEIEAALAKLGAGPFAVRSSGVEEDGASSAHAGQFETELNVAPGEVMAAAMRVWRSGFSETLAAYRKAHGLSAAPQPPAVIVQRMAAARAAGVAFSACPVSGARDTVVISAVNGLADRLVAGEVDGDSYRLDGRGCAVEAMAGEEPVLTNEEQKSVADLARRAEAHFGCPQDIEWAFEGDRLYLLQSRPITTLPALGAVTSDETLTIWDNSNIVESYAGVTSPLTYSFARYVYAHVYRAFSKLMGVSPHAIEENNAVFENMLGRVDGRVYYNLINWYRALALFPGFQANRRFMEEMMGVAEALPADLAREIAPPPRDAWAKIVDQARFTRVGAGLIAHGIILPDTIKRFYTRLNAALAKSDAQIEAMSATALAAEYRALERQLLARWDAPLINDFLCMIAFGASRRALESWAGPEGLALHGEVMIGQGDIVSAEPARMIRAMGAMLKGRPEITAQLARGNKTALAGAPEVQAAFEKYIAKFGDRCTQELKLESLTLHEDPAPVLMAIAAAARTGHTETRAIDPAVRLAVLFKDKPVNEILASWLLKWAKARVRDRENLRFERTRLFGRVRRILLTLGARFTAAGKLDAPRDIFLLTVEEAIGAVEGGGVGQDLKALVDVRRVEDAASRARPDPPERFESKGAHLIGLGALKAATPAAEAEGETRKGLGCCAGIVTARVRVIADPRSEALEPGEILVARHTDPGWIAVFTNAAGVIAERGSLLSHSAIVAREMGAPCVVALKSATTWLRTGDLVRLDGGAGTVERLEAAP